MRAWSGTANGGASEAVRKGAPGCDSESAVPRTISGRSFTIGYPNTALDSVKERVRFFASRAQSPVASGGETNTDAAVARHDTAAAEVSAGTTGQELGSELRRSASRFASSVGSQPLHRLRQNSQPRSCGTFGTGSSAANDRLAGSPPWQGFGHGFLSRKNSGVLRISSSTTC